MEDKGQIILYQTEDGQSLLNVHSKIKQYLAACQSVTMPALLPSSPQQSTRINLKIARNELIEPSKKNMKRTSEIDFVKCVMILLMISFHLVYIGDTYPEAKQLVYTFHMPCFLIISGYLLNMKKPLGRFLKDIVFIALPYAIMETGYIVCATILPIREHIDNLTFTGYLNMLVFHPIGPYWYLQTLMICSVVCRLVETICSRIGEVTSMTKLMTMGIILWLITNEGIISLSSCIYFMIGVTMKSCNVVYEKFFKGTWMSVVLFVLFAVLTVKPHCLTITGAAIIFLATSVSLFLHDIIKRFLPKVQSICLFIGRNTLPILLFSPIFTILAKIYQPHLLSIDHYGILFLIISVVFATIGSLTIGWIIDHIKCRVFKSSTQRYVKIV